MEQGVLPKTYMPVNVPEDCDPADAIGAIDVFFMFKEWGEIGGKGIVFSQENEEEEAKFAAQTIVLKNRDCANWSKILSSHVENKNLRN